MKIVLLVTAVLTVSVSLFGQGCESLNTPSQSLEYLQHTAKSAKTAACVEEAFNKIAKLAPKDAIPIFIGYLGYKRPLDEAEQLGFFMHGPLPNVLYPAVQALYDIGPVAEPALLDFLASESTPDSIEAKNALYTLSLIHHGALPALIKELSRRAATVPGTSMADNLHVFVTILIGQCPDAFKQKCENAARPGIL